MIPEPVGKRYWVLMRKDTAFSPEVIWTDPFDSRAKAELACQEYTEAAKQNLSWNAVVYRVACLVTQEIAE